MKISELIKQLKYELEETGDIEVYISIASRAKDVVVSGGALFSTKNLVTSCDNVKDDVFEFGIKNWVL